MDWHALVARAGKLGAELQREERALNSFGVEQREVQAAETSAPAISAMLIYILMAAILYFRPQGLFPPKGR